MDHIAHAAALAVEIGRQEKISRKTRVRKTGDGRPGSEIESNQQTLALRFAQEQQEMIKEADELRDKALALRRAAGIPDPPALAGNNAPPMPDGFREAVERLHPLRVGGNIQTPMKTHDVKPIYPLEARDAGVQGVIIIEALLNAEGRVEDARILKSIPMLDAAALEAVRQWEYMPTLLNGQPVPFMVTVTVNFTLSKAGERSSDRTRM